MTHIKHVFITLVLNLNSVIAQESIKPFDTLQVTDITWSQQHVRDILNDEGATLLIFWATWNAPAKRLLMEISEKHTELMQKTNAQVVAIAIDDDHTLERIPEYVEAKEWEFDVYFDPDRKLLHGLNVNLAPPLTFIIDKDGTILYIHHGYHQGDEEEIFERLFINK